ncbi:hypothetical protein JCM1393_07250 [Clostridium carnis]
MIEIIKKAKEGNVDAKETLLEIFNPLIISVGESYYIFDYDQEDIRQIAKLAILKGIESIDNEKLKYFPAYIAKIVKNTLATEVKKATKRYKLIKEDNEEGIKEEAVHKIAIEDEVVNNINREKLSKALKVLDNKEIALLNKIYIDNITIAEYSRSLEMPYYKVINLHKKIIEKLFYLMEF